MKNLGRLLRVWQVVLEPVPEMVGGSAMEVLWERIAQM